MLKDLIMSKITAKKGQSHRHARKGNGGCPQKFKAKKASGTSQQKALAPLGAKTPKFTQNTETEVITKTGEHRLDHKEVIACIQYAEHKGIWVAEYRYMFRCGGYEGQSLPLTTRSKRHTSQQDAVTDACERMAVALADTIHEGDLAGRQKGAFCELTDWIAAIKQQQQASTASTLTGLRFVDCFAGIGGFHLALKALGAECAGAVEIDKSARATYQQNHHGSYVMHDDITTATAAQFGRVDIVCGGFPCQSFSVAGNGEGFNHPTKGALFFQLARFIGEAKPKLFILENVKGLAMHDGGATYETVMDTLTSLGYVVSSKLLDAATFGTAQHRERIFLVGVRADSVEWQQKTFAFPVGTDSSVVVEDILGHAPESYGLAPREMTRLKDFPTERQDRIALVGNLGRNTQSARVASPKGKGYTLCASVGSYYWINGRPRRLTPRECARMQGFPESFKLHKSPGTACKQFGNAVAVPVVKAIAHQLGAFALKAGTPFPVSNLAAGPVSITN